MLERLRKAEQEAAALREQLASMQKQGTATPANVS